MENKENERMNCPAIGLSSILGHGLDYIVPEQHKANHF
jgi:hypothetical protein